MSKIATVEKCLFTNKWNNPRGADIYYHELQLSNGEKVSCGTEEKYPEKITEGAEIEYEMNGQKVKLIKRTEEGTQMSGKYDNSNGGGGAKPKAKASGGGAKSYKKKPEDFMGYCSRYAVDMVIAGKTTKKDVDKAIEIFRRIYQEHIDLLDEPLAPTSQTRD